MYRFMNYKIIVLASAVLLTACGQSGALHLPSDANADKRAKYLIYPDTPAQQKQEKQAAPVATESELSNSNPTP
nr:lipoprotein [Acinetobacter sp. CFCC 11171]